MTPEIDYPYMQFEEIDKLPSKFVLRDHLGGFDQDLKNPLLSSLQSYAQAKNVRYEIILTQVATQDLRDRYPNLDFLCDIEAHDSISFRYFLEYRCHPDHSYDHFVCSFNGAPHVSRQMLVSILHRFGWYDPHHVSKNFAYDVATIDGHLHQYVGQTQQRFYRKFFIGANSEDFFQTINSFGYVRFDHKNNIFNIEKTLASNFLHIVSETLATSYYPFVTEKFLYSVVTRGLFLAYAPPGWHDHLERYYGFRKYDKIFDYRFDSIRNPVERLTELISMISKFSVLSSDDWIDLYEMEKDTVNHNYDHYFSRGYLRVLRESA